MDKVFVWIVRQILELGMGENIVRGGYEYSVIRVKLGSGLVSNLNTQDIRQKIRANRTDLRGERNTPERKRKHGQTSSTHHGTHKKPDRQ